MDIINIILIALVLAVVWVVAIYNGLVKRRFRVREAWSDIDVQLKRRYDLIPNLVEAVKGYATHESGTLDRVIQARAKAMGATTVAEKDEANNMISSSLKSIFALSENYPQLRAVESFAKLQEELSDTENKIQAARRFYNGNVMELNTAIETFPSNLIAGSFGFAKEEFFGLENAEEREAVKVKF